MVEAIAGCVLFSQLVYHWVASSLVYWSRMRLKNSAPARLVFSRLSSFFVGHEVKGQDAWQSVWLFLTSFSLVLQTRFGSFRKHKKLHFDLTCFFPLHR